MGPVLGVGAAGAGMDLADRVALVVVAGEQGPQLEPVQLVDEGPEAGLDLGLQRLVTLLAGELVERLEVGDPAIETVDELHVFAGPGVSRRQVSGPVGVIPEVGFGRQGLLELREARPSDVHTEVRARPRRGGGRRRGHR